MVLEPSGRLRVHEDFVYTMGSDEQHGFRRFIPYVVDYDDQFTRRYEIEDIAVSASPVNGRVVAGDPSGVDDLVVADDYPNRVIRIGNAATFIEGQWRFVIDYTV